MGAAGIDVQGRIELSEVVLAGNAGDGLRVVGGASRLADVTPAFNGGSGINGDVMFPVNARDVVATCNLGVGIQGGPVSRLVDSAAFNSGSDGIAVGPNSLATGTVATVNAGFGINCTAVAAYAGSVLDLNGGGGTGNQASSSCIQTGTNLCGGNTTCP